MITTRTPFLLGPLLLTAYGLLRYVDGLDGVRGPGPAWTVGHLAFLAGVGFLLWGLVLLGRATGPDRLGAVGRGLAWVGAAAFGVQFGTDVLFGLLSADHAELSARSADFMAIPGVKPAFYLVGPLLFFVGQVLVFARAAARGLVGWWVPALVLLSAVLPMVAKDLIPVGGVLLLLAHLPLMRRVG
ncbi:hypothetical protein ACN20G_17090 [Streptomyces sp. BI20]|uniref:hypothetical protein n=1 Tax=Streptomyces sp. BI20 TaxID=3403460 RepID=UPI003C716A54